MQYYLGIDVGGTAIKGGIFSEKDGLLYSEMVDTGVLGEALDNIIFLIQKLLCKTKISGKKITASGITVPGLIQGEKGPVVYAPNVGWENIDLVSRLEEKLSCPVFLFPDAASAAVGESCFGAGNAYRSFLFLTLGTAIGTAFVWEGKLFSQHGKYGAEMAHIPLRGKGVPCSCGLPGCFQQYGSATALRYQAAEMMKKEPNSMLFRLCGGEENRLTVKMVFDALALGDLPTRLVIEQFTSYLAEGIGGLINIFRPEAVVIGGGLSNGGELLFRLLRKKVPGFVYASRWTGSPKIEKARLGEWAGIYGAAEMARERGIK